MDKDKHKGFILLKAVFGLLFLLPACRQAGPETQRVPAPAPPVSGLPFFTLNSLNPIWQITPKTPIVSIPAFQLIDQDGRPRDQTLFQNKISVVGFMFTSCQGFCPFLMEGMKAVEREAGQMAARVQFIAFTVNPDEDTPERLKAYSIEKQINTETSWTLLTGNKATIYALAQKTFATEASRRATGPAGFVHSERLYVIDEESRLRGILNGTRVNLRSDAKAMLNQLSHY